MRAPPFLQRLGIELDADERAIKRAYARELKQIDQEADIAGFQQLREAYEMALAWVKRQPVTQAAPAQPVAAQPQAQPPTPESAQVPQAQTAPRRPVPAARPVQPAIEAEDPRQLAEATFDQFLRAGAAIVAEGSGHDSAAWRKQLQQAMNDDRLVNISARANFEFLVARLLANGWQSGQDALFVAARQVFGWDKDRRRLFELGELGAWINQAIDEGGMFTEQTSEDCSGQADAIDRVRQPREPSRAELLVHVPHLRTMAARFPAWTSIIASAERIEQWFAMEQAIPAWRRHLRVGAKVASAESDAGFKWWKIAVVLLVIRVLFEFTGSRSDQGEGTKGFYPPQTAEERDEEAYRRAAGASYVPPGVRRTLPVAPTVLAPVPEPGRFLNKAEIEKIWNAIDADLPHVKPRDYKAAFTVTLDARGGIGKITKHTSSGLLVLDKRAEEAIRAAAPFSAEIQRVFTLQLGWRYSPRQVIAAPAQAAAKAPQRASFGIAERSFGPGENADHSTQPAEDPKSQQAE